MLGRPFELMKRQLPIVCDSRAWVRMRSVRCENTGVGRLTEGGRGRASG
jgi:hypothetical protein